MLEKDAWQHLILPRQNQDPQRVIFSHDISYISSHSQSETPETEKVLCDDGLFKLCCETLSALKCFMP